MKNCKQIATEWGLSERTVNDLCKKNKIDGAIKVGNIRLYFLLSRMLSLIPGRQLSIRLEIYYRRSLEDIRSLRPVKE